MKKLFAITVTLLCLTQHSKAQITFQTTIGNTGKTEVINDIIQIPDSSYLVIGKAITNITSILVSKISSNGNLLWSKSYGSFSSSVGKSIKQTSDGGFITCSYAEGYGGMLLMKLDSEGNVVFSKSFGGQAERLIITSDGGYAIIGQTTNPDLDIFLIKTDKDGNLVFGKTYGGTGLDYGYDLKETSDGGFIFTGYAKAFDDNAILIKTDGSGVVTWSKSFGNTGFANKGRAVAQTSDGGYLLAIDNGQSTTMTILKTLSDGTLSWQKYYTGYDPRSIVKASDGNFVITGYYNNAGEDKIYLLKIDETGSVQFTNHYGDAGSSVRGYGLTLTSDNGFAIAGSTNDQLYIAKTDMNGKIYCHSDSIPIFSSASNLPETTPTLSSGTSLNPADQTMFYAETTLNENINCCNGISTSFSVSNTSVCQGERVTFTNLDNSVSSYTLVVEGFGYATFEDTISFVFDSVGTFIVDLVVSSGVCLLKSSKTITVQENPKAAFSYVDSSLTVKFTNNSINGVLYSWAFGDGQTSAAPVPTHIYATDSTYQVCLTTTGAVGCASKICQDITVCTAFANFDNSRDSVCLGGTINFTNTSTGSSIYQWFANNQVVSTDMSPTLDFSMPGSVQMVLTASSGFCEDTAVANVYVNNTYSQIGTLVLCAGDSALLGGSYQNTAGSYVDTYQTIGFCDSVVTTNLSFHSVANSSFVNLDTMFCYGLTAYTLEAIPAGGVFSGIGVSGNTFNPSSAGPGMHLISYQLTDSNGCMLSIDTTITVDICDDIIESIDNEKITIHPNPNLGKFTIEYHGDNNEDLQIIIYNSLLQNVYYRKVNTNLGIVREEFALDNFRAGIYFLELKNKHNYVVRKLLIGGL